MNDAPAPPDASRPSPTGPERRPIWGFGPVGWVATMAGGLILGLAASGVDLQFEAVRLLTLAFGIDFTQLFVRTLMPPLSFTLFGMAFSFVPLFGLAVAFHLRPGRFPVWAFVLLCLVSLSYSAQWIRPWGVLNNPAQLGVTRLLLISAVSETATAWAAAGVLFWSTRSRVLTVTYAVWPVVATGLQFARYHAGLPDLFVLGAPDWVAGVTVWSLLGWGVLGGIPVGWALRERRRVRPNHGEVCRSCGYPRAGLDPAIPCPECGSTLGPAGALGVAPEPGAAGA